MRIGSRLRFMRSRPVRYRCGMDWQLLTQLLIADGVGGVIANYVSTSSGRRDARTRMLEQLRNLGEPQSRHNPTEEAAFLDAALVARVPRALADYVFTRESKCRALEGLARRIESRPTRSVEGISFERAMTEMVAARDARARLTAALVQYAWRPWWTKATWRLTTLRATRVVSHSRGTQLAS